MVCLTQRIGKGKTLDVCIHKLVAFAFQALLQLLMGEVKGCSIVDHIDEDKSIVTLITYVGLLGEKTILNLSTTVDKNTPEEDEAYRQRQKIAKRDYMRRKRDEEKATKIEESVISN